MMREGELQCTLNAAGVCLNRLQGAQKEYFSKEKSYGGHEEVDLHGASTEW
jgi:hypothetical protein